MIVRPEMPADSRAIHALTEAAFKNIEHSSQTEAVIVDALRDVGALSISLVAEQNNAIVGHVAFSPVRIAENECGWFGLGPVSVSPNRQRRGIGSTLIRDGLDILRRRGAAGCVVLGDPNYYQRFGFSSHHSLHYGDVPPEYFQSLVLAGEPAKGEVSYHKGFEAECDK